VIHLVTWLVWFKDITLQQTSSLSQCGKYFSNQGFLWCNKSNLIAVNAKYVFAIFKFNIVMSAISSPRYRHLHWPSKNVHRSATNPVLLLFVLNNLNQSNSLSEPCKKKKPLCLKVRRQRKLKWSHLTSLIT